MYIDIKFMENNFFHNSKYKLYLDTSQIENSGFGVFTEEYIEKNNLIDEYVGDKTPIGGSYVVEINENFGIDAFNYPRCYMAMLNDAQYIPKKIIKKKKKKIDLTPDKNYNKNGIELQNNCEFVIKNNRCFIYSVRDIQEKEELFISYGEKYWNNY